MITKYGFDTAITLIIVAIAIIAVGFFFSHIALKVAFIVIGASVLLFTLNFFRDPDRVTPSVVNGIIAPEDGKVISISRVVEPEFLGGEAMQVCIFMSPVNVHVNRIPLSGAVKFFRYIEGEYIVAFDEKASERNERTLIGIDNGKFKILFKQIAGFIARRIVCPLKIGDSVVVGERFGMIKFGSRVDVLMPVDAKVQVQLDQHTVAGETVLAVIPE